VSIESKEEDRGTPEKKGDGAMGLAPVTPQYAEEPPQTPRGGSGFNMRNKVRSAVLAY
jgi:hypothetical protein